MLKFFLMMAIASSAVASDRDTRLLDRANQNIAIATVCWDERNYDCFERYMHSAIVKLNAIEEVDTVGYVLERITREAAWHLIDVWRDPNHGLAP